MVMTSAVITMATRRISGSLSVRSFPRPVPIARRELALAGTDIVRSLVFGSKMAIPIEAAQTACVGGVGQEDLTFRVGRASTVEVVSFLSSLTLLLVLLPTMDIPLTRGVKVISLWKMYWMGPARACHPTWKSDTWMNSYESYSRHRVRSMYVSP